MKEIVASGMDAATLAEVFRGAEPVVIRGLISDWQIVSIARQGAQAVSDYLNSLYNGAPVGVIRGEPAIGGKFFYRDDMRGVNFGRTQAPFDVAMQLLLAEMLNADPASVYIQSLPMSQFFPRFMERHQIAALGPSIAPRIWIGNALTVQTHFDLLKNVACLVTGKRRFTLFPPDQLPNLYVGPLDLTPSGVPVSMVKLDAPDFEKYPRFREALPHARVADLEPGDAIYIPFAWWHHVQSLTSFNILVNYWWSEGGPNSGSYDTLLHATAVLRELPEQERKVWRGIFDYFVFKTSGEPLAHLQPEHRGLLGEMTPQRIAEIRSLLAQKFR
jgi:hypothetical protein